MRLWQSRPPEAAVCCKQMRRWLGASPVWCSLPDVEAVSWESQTRWPSMKRAAPVSKARGSGSVVSKPELDPHSHWPRSGPKECVWMAAQPSKYCYTYVPRKVVAPQVSLALKDQGASWWVCWECWVGVRTVVEVSTTMGMFEWAIRLEAEGEFGQVLWEQGLQVSSEPLRVYLSTQKAWSLVGSTMRQEDSASVEGFQVVCRTLKASAWLETPRALGAKTGGGRDWAEACLEVCLRWKVEASKVRPEVSKGFV